MDSKEFLNYINKNISYNSSVTVHVAPQYSFFFAVTNFLPFFNKGSGQVNF